MINIPIILVDDDKLDRYVMSRRIRESVSNCTIHEFDAGDRFLEAFSDSHRYAEIIGAEAPAPTVILDINMPRLSGFDVLDELTKLREQDTAMIPDYFTLLMVTSSNHEADREMAQSYSLVSDYMIKPLDTDLFKKTLDRVYEPSGD